MAGDEINIAANAMMMIHDPEGGARGAADDMRKMAELLDTVKGTLVDTYDRRTKAGIKNIAQWMTDETWLTAANAVSNGFADKVTAEQTVSASYGNTLTNFRNTPPALLARAAGFPLRDMFSVQQNRMRVKTF